jgi:hypothetical protein
MEREELWQRMEKQAADNYEHLKAQGSTISPPPLLTSSEIVMAPFGKHSSMINCCLLPTSYNRPVANLAVVSCL